MGLFRDGLHDFVKDTKILLGLQEEPKTHDEPRFSADDPNDVLNHPDLYQRHLYQKNLESCRDYMREILERRDECEEVYNVLCSLRENGIKNPCYGRCNSTSGENFECLIGEPGYLEHYQHGKCIGMEVFNGKSGFSYYIVFDISGDGRLFFLSSDKQTEFRLEEIADTLNKAERLERNLFWFKLGISGLEYAIRYTLSFYKEQLREEAYK